MSKRKEKITLVLTKDDILEIIDKLREIAKENKRKKKSRYPKIKEKYKNVPLRKELYILLKTYCEKEDLGLNDFILKILRFYVKSVYKVDL